MFCRFAREKRLRLWKDYVPSAPIVPIQNKEFTGKVSGDVCRIIPVPRFLSFRFNRLLNKKLLPFCSNVFPAESELDFCASQDKRC